MLCVADCSRSAVARGLCRPHHKQWRRGSTLSPIGSWTKPRTLLPNPDRAGTLLVPLTQGFFAVIDKADARVVGARNWSVKIDRKRKNRYAASSTKRPDGKWAPVSLHRFLWTLWKKPATPELDHRNTDGLDCRRSNIRAAELEQNRWNRGKTRGNTSGFKGVTKDRSRRKWTAQIQVRGKNHYLGTFGRAEDAAAAYAAAARRLHGRFARTEA